LTGRGPARTMIRGWVVRLNALESILHKVQQPFTSWDAFLAGISGGVRTVSDLNSGRAGSQSTILRKS